jgi:hypothetical protein
MGGVCGHLTPVLVHQQLSSGKWHPQIRPATRSCPEPIEGVATKLD